MDSQLKTDWVAALRSGDYEQCHTTLHCDGGYCCLGVLLDIYDSSFFEEHSGTDDTGYDLIKGELGLSKEQVQYLWSMNDGIGGLGGYSFGEIADYIENEKGL